MTARAAVRRTATVFALMLALAVPALAANDRPNEVAGSFDLVSGSDIGRSWDADVELDASLTRLLSLGPLVRATYVNPPGEGAGSDTAIRAGAVLTVYTTESHNGFSFGAEATVLTQDVDGYDFAPFGQLQLGNDWAKLRVRASYAYHSGADHETTDLDRTSVRAGLAFAF